MRALVAFQATYDYIDTLAEQPSADPVANGHQLHLALLTALDPDGDHADYYEHSCTRRRQRLHEEPRRHLPIRASPRCHRTHPWPSRRCARHGGWSPTRASTTATGVDAHGALARWASGLTPAGTGLRWWETAAGAASSLTRLRAHRRRGTAGARSGEAASPRTPTSRGSVPCTCCSTASSTAARTSRRGTTASSTTTSSAEEAASRLGVIAVRAMSATERLPNGAAARDDPGRDDELLPLLARDVDARRVPGRAACARRDGRAGDADDGRAARPPRSP